MEARHQLRRVVSGGQTGVDRVALEIALEAKLAVGGWCPRGRRAEDGTIPSCFPLRETPSACYRQRTRWNVRDSQGTLILTAGFPTGGTALTLWTAVKLKKPYLVLDPSAAPLEALERIAQWVLEHQIGVLNVAGPRYSQQPVTAHAARELLTRWWLEPT